MTSCWMLEIVKFPFDGIEPSSNRSHKNLSREVIEWDHSSHLSRTIYSIICWIKPSALGSRQGHYVKVLIGVSLLAEVSWRNWLISRFSQEPSWNYYRFDYKIFPWDRRLAHVQYWTYSIYVAPIGIIESFERDTMQVIGVFKSMVFDQEYSQH